MSFLALLCAQSCPEGSWNAATRDRISIEGDKMLLLALTLSKYSVVFHALLINSSLLINGLPQTWQITLTFSYILFVVHA